VRNNYLNNNILSPGYRRFLGGLALGLQVFLMSAAWANAQSGIVTRPVFDRKETFGIGPRAMGMGGAFTAVADDSSAVYWNVAGLAQLSAYEISISSAPVYFRDKVGTADAFGFPWFASLQFMMPIANDNTFGISYFRPFHPQRDFYAGDTTMSQGNREEGSYFQNPSFQQDELILSYAARFSSVKNFSIGVNVKRITNDPYYIRFLGDSQSETLIAQQLQSPVRVVGFGVDLGLLYRIPITKYSEEFRIGLSLKDMVTTATYSNGFKLTDPGANILFDEGTGDIPVAPEITLGLAYKNNFLFKVRNITAFDFDQISSPNVSDAENKILRFGTEFWLFKDVLGLRTGYSTFLSRPGFIHLGLSVRALNGDFQTDVAYIMPVAPSASVSEGSQTGYINTGGINFEPFHIGISYRFGGGEEVPPAKVKAFVRPASFTPSQGEKAGFYLDTTEDVSINSWSVLIYDSSNHLVRGLRGKGSPPTKLLWSGENDQYEPLPPGVYTWAFQVLDQLDHVGSTPVQTVEILGPSSADTLKDPGKLLAIRQQQAELLAQERQQLTALAQENLKKLLGVPEATPTTANAAQTPVEANGNTLVPEAGTVPALGFNNVAKDQVLNTHFDKNPEGDTIIVVSYRSNLTFVPYLYQEAAEVIKTSVNSVGTGLKGISTRVYYGKNELTLETTTQAAANFASGKIDQMKLLQLSDIKINGAKVGPNGY